MLAETLDSQWQDRQAYLPAVHVETSPHQNVNMVRPFSEAVSPVPCETDGARTEPSAEGHLIREHGGRKRVASEMDCGLRDIRVYGGSQKI